ncbi:hypothetical protein N136_00105 [Leifsonia aquatica ATCC 14665]|uniref:DUF2384 domain-containing protein n=2 Tax=Leifsonia aquatica TaxID=144185 RepID=U2TFT1_LEIAQ|nr:hypothetical protein N136_00105 [Leifsonia aquatica ATCC 14665]MBB2967995.1 hypothetical protein [Leifsonia aquatica]
MQTPFEPQPRLQLTLTDNGAWQVTVGDNVALVFDFQAGTVMILDDDLTDRTVRRKRIDTIEVGVPASEPPTERPDLGPLLTEEELLDRLGIGPETLRRFEEDRVVLRIVTESAYPAFQVVDGKLLPGLRNVLGELADGIDFPPLHWKWLTRPADWADGKPPWELLRDGRVDEVIQAAGRAAWVWRDQNRGYA